MALQTEIEGPVSRMFRRASIQRRSRTNGNFDGVWRDITDYVKKWGTIRSAIDDIRLNKFQHGGVSLTVNNDTGAFNHETNRNSLWFNYLSRYRTLLRLEAGYYDSTTYNELPATSTVGYFILDEEIQIRSDSNDVSLNGSSLQSIFHEVRARDVAGIFGATTASGVVSRIRDHTDGAGVNIFRSFITSTAWVITSSANQYSMTTDLVEDLSTWDLMEKLAESEGYVVLINRQGGIEFRDRTPRTTTSQFSFRGQDFPRPTIMAIREYKEAYNKYYNYFRVKYLQADTATSFITAGTTTAVNATNPSWLFGQRTYELENTLIQNTATAQSIASNLFTTFGTMTSEALVKVAYHPSLELLDRIDMSFHSYDLANSTIWDAFDWAPNTGDTGATWSVEGENFEWDSRQFVITARDVNLDDFSMTIRARDLTA